MINPFKPHTYQVRVKITFNDVDEIKTVTVEARHGFIARQAVEEEAYDHLRDLARRNPEHATTGLVTVLEVERVETETVRVAA